MVASVKDRFGKYPDFLLMKPHCLVTFSDPRLSWISSEVHYRNTVLCSITQMESIVIVMEMTAPNHACGCFINNKILIDYLNVEF